MKTVIVSVATVRVDSVDYSRVDFQMNVETPARMVASLIQLCATLLLVKQMVTVIVAFVVLSSLG